MEKDRATQYWDNEIKRAAENTAKAYAEYQQANQDELEAYSQKIDADSFQPFPNWKEFTTTRQ